MQEKEERERERAKEAVRKLNMRKCGKHKIERFNIKTKIKESK